METTNFLTKFLFFNGVIKRTTAVFSDLKNSQRWEYSRRNRIGIRLLFQLLIGRDAASKLRTLMLDGG